MNAFIPQNPKVVLGVTANGKVFCHSNNIDPEIQVVVATTPEEFKEASKGVPFVTLNLPRQTS
jgi:hypothetical protein